MRPAIVAMVVALLLCGCMSRPPRSDPNDEVGYNRRELPPAQGLFTGCDGVWTVYGNNPDRPEACPPKPDERREEGDAPDGAAGGEPAEQ